MNKSILPFYLFGLLPLFVACGTKQQEYDATGTFEATEVVVSAEQSGQLLTFSIGEGDNVGQGQEIGLIDTTQVWLKIQQLGATKEVYQSQKPDLQKQIAATRQQLSTAKTEQQRYEELVADGAAPRKMLDDATSQVQVLQRQLDAQISSLNTQLSTLNSQQTAVDVQVSQLRDQLSKCHVVAPINGTVMEKYVERGEFVTVGKPLVKVADTENMYIRAYVTSAQLKSVKIGQQAKVFADYGDGQKKEYEGTVSWISGRSEFTPKTILTNDERADLVYAVKVAIKNDGFAKIGMYGEVKFTETPGN
ncbi:MAG: HlyD family efflux transporter periplasmic adaptor subunit [Prevotella sp.]|nr:HlyD family efflux transporter periplasmic adaptor subunit [Prevotella sp.]MBQ8453641.1 HlyD family efflux transporter periplasmic adaptor subunit [Prevotella sp.]